MADCSRCVGLCCIALAFDRGESFGFDKAAGDRCVHLTHEGRCRIHGEREARGFGGCVGYDCGGAGPRAVATGRRGHELLEAFRVEREVREARELLEAAARLPLPRPDEARRAELAHRLTAETWNDLATPIGAFVRGLRRLPIYGGA